jgi:ADP-L-glycero-D-manno-heptose 6-epimerase
MFEHYVEQHPPRRSVAQLFRYFNVYGPGEAHKGTQASPQHQFAMQALQTGVIRVFDNSDRYHRDFVHVDRVLGVHEAMMKSDASGVFNVGTGQTRSFLDIAKAAAEEHDAKIQYIPMPDILRDSYQTYTCADLTKLTKTLDR